ncbi:pilus assembly protein [Pseudoxanthomonas suwonensis]|uniref:PilY1 beta-propeller domain-containing protein n=1 Tax=Pseudoxanthomonas suwonensis TaxID=314722 RepID=A0A0E3Z2M3_9GAMM|nr:PilC/PilY family type IV pilus protein [Pseudoxanthomonas suwonensis]AKC87479.1 hypothetical protein WQ53_12650 [Pseudoxanthomonas suwonensis]
MASRRFHLTVAAAVVALGAGGYYLYQAFAVQGQGTLAQAPLNIQSSVTPAFMMAIDDSGSMMFQNQFPGNDGKGCWGRDTSTQPYSFFVTSGANAGQVRAQQGVNLTCDFAYSYGAHYRLNDNAGTNTWVGIPPVDTFGFARSHEFNPAYFNPSVTYQPWLNSLGVSYANATPASARIDPSGNVTTATVNLTVPVESVQMANGNGNLSSKFRLLTGMHLPAGTVYQLRLADDCGTGASTLTGGNVWHTVPAGGITTNAACDVFIRHYLPTFYLRQDTAVPVGYESVSRELVNNACGAGCNMYRYTIAASNTAAMQNFANWFSYYGNRHKSLIAGLTHSMASVNDLRAGYFRISQYDSRGYTTDPVTTAGQRVAMRELAVQAQKDALYTDILARPSWSSTFNRQAVQAAGRQFRRTDSGAPVQLSCQKNAIMLFTDGYSNNNGPTVGNVDGTMGAPFQDLHSDTLADIATQYYVNDGGNSPIRPDMTPGNVPVPGVCPTTDPRVDCQSNLHVNFYGVTLNGRGNLFNPDIVQDPYTDSSIYNNWPTRQNDNRSTIDDIWHAAVNTRGELVNARTPVDIIDAIRRILRAVGEGSSPSGTIGLTGSRIGAGSLTVVPFYEALNEGTDWYSTLTAQSVASNPLTGQVSLTTLWEASDRLPSAAVRSTKVWYGASDGSVRLFNAGNLTLADLCNNPAAGMSLCTAPLITSRLGVDISQAVSYLLGDSTLEVANGGPLRDRSGPLGDIINSTPVVVSPANDYGYRVLQDGSGNYDWLDYAGYLTSKAAASGPPAMVYAGANDGMLHAFHGETGVEQFAYVPATARGHMGNLLFPYVDDEVGQIFEHRYYVDGPITVSDTYYGSAWHTTLVGTAGAGGRSVFAIDVTNPTTFSATSRRWEITDQHTNATVRNNIGHVLGRPVIVPVKNTTGAVSWKAIFGNGYNSINGQAALYVVDIGTGAVQVIPAVETGAPAGSNGLGNIVVIDRWGGSTLNTPFRDGYADTVYAGDQKGALWKFDLRAATPASPAAPVFIAQDPSNASIRQPIMGGLTAAFGPGGGLMVYFGTGSFSFVNDGDPANSHVQSLYAVNDRGGTTTLTRADLHVQTITADADGVAQVSSTPMTAGKSGWRIDLPASERFVGYPQIANGIVFYPTYDPRAGAGCTGNGSNRLFGLNALNGAAGLGFVRVGSPTGDPYASGTGAVPLNTGGSAPAKDVAVMTTPRISPLGAGASDDDLAAALAAQCSMVVQAPGAPPLYMPRACGRQSWRQIR